jgi:tetratricopeptide (TPR) repeat protein
VLLRRITFVVLLAASAAVLLLSLYLLWNARPWDYLPFIDRPSTNLDARSQLLSDKIDIYNHEIEDLGKMVALLLVLSGLYVIAFALFSHFAAERYQSLCGKAVDMVHEDFAMLVGDLRDVYEQAQRAVERAAIDCGRVEELLRQNPAAKPADAVPPLDVPAAAERLTAQVERARASGRSASFEISDCEHALAALALLAGPEQAALLAPVYRDLARHHERREPGRARFYRERANALAPGIAPEPRLAPPPAPPPRAERPREGTAGDSADPLDSARAKYNLAVLNRSAGRLDDDEDLLRGALALARNDSVLAAEIQYELACIQALRGPGRFAQAMEHLREAFRSKTPSVEQRISQDIDEGGPLHALASQPPFDKAVNDLLLDVSVS